GRVGRAGGVGRPLPHVVGRLGPGVFQHARLDAAAPQVLVDAVGAAGRDGDGDAVVGGVPDLLLAAPAPLAHGRDDLQVGGQRAHRDVEAHLVVALAGAAVRHGGRTLLPRVVHEDLGDERPRQRGGERIGVAVDGARLQRGEDEVAHEQVFGVHHVGRGGARAQRLLADRREVALVADVGGHGDNVHVVVLVQPGDGDRGVQAARVGKYDFLHRAPSACWGGAPRGRQPPHRGPPAPFFTIGYRAGRAPARRRAPAAWRALSGPGGRPGRVRL